MSRCTTLLSLVALLLAVVANASLLPSLDLSNVPAQVGDSPINGLCADFYTKFNAKPEWDKLVGSWYSVAVSMPSANDSQTNQIQTSIDQTIGCYKEHADALNEPYILNMTLDIVFRQPVNASYLPPNCLIIGNNEARCPYSMQAANSSNPSDGHVLFQMPTQKGLVQGSGYWIAVDYNNFAVFYSCVAVPGSTTGEQSYSYGVLSRYPKQLNTVQKYLYKLLAKAAGVKPAGTDPLFDFPQDQCF